MVMEMSEQEGDQERPEARPYASTAGEGAGEGVAEARERLVSIERATWGDLKGISLAEGLVRIEQRVAAIGRMVTKEDLAGINQAMKAMVVGDGDSAGPQTGDRHGRPHGDQDLNDATMTILRWNVSLILAGIAIMAGVTFGILQIVIVNLP